MTETAFVNDETHGYANPMGYQYWFNPEDRKVYATTKEPKHGFTDNSDAFAVFDVDARISSLSKIKKASMEGIELSSLNLQTPYIDSEFYNMFVEWKDNVLAGGRQKSAALTSPSNSVVNILNVFPRVYGKKDRQYAGKELAQEVSIPNLVLDVDTLAKYSGMAEIGELQMPFAKEIRYSRQHIEAQKYGLVFEISEEAILKNVHNPLQDSIEVAGTKVAQREAYDVVSAFNAGVTTVAALGAWDTFVAGTDRSTTNPKLDVTRIVTSTIEATGIGGTFNMIGMHANTHVGGWEPNSFIKNMFEAPPDPDWAPGVQSIKGLKGVGYVQDQFIPQGKVFLADVGDESCMLLAKGPTRIASKKDEFSGSERYGIFTFHKAVVINSNTGRIVLNAATPLAPA